MRQLNETFRVLLIGGDVRRTHFGPGLWPGPRRQARWAGSRLQGQRRAEGAPRVAPGGPGEPHPGAASTRTHFADPDAG
jgi:hypothetical protein